MHFLSWILDKRDEPGDVGLISNAIWTDINNGCAVRYTEPIEWAVHFIRHHPRMSKALNSKLAVAKVEYENSLTPKIK